MHLRISSQVQALDSYRQYGVGKGSAAVKSEGTGSSHSAGNNAYDTTALFISGRVRANSGGLTEASRRAQESISQMQSADVALQKASTTLGNMRDLAVKSADIATPGADRIVLDYEFTQFKFELSRIGTLSFNGVDYSKSDVSAFFSAQVSSGSGAAQITIKSSSIDAIGDISSVDGAVSAISTISNAMDEIASARVKLGEAQVKIMGESQGANQGAGSSVNIQRSESRIRDTSAAVKMAEQVKSDLMDAPANSILAIANAIPQAVLQLLG